VDGEALVRASRLTAKIDNNAIADGFQLYLHTFIVNTQGEWVVVQQGMNNASGLARRYHWHSRAVHDFTSDPHAGIVGEYQGTLMNLVDVQAKPAQDAMLEIVHEKPEKMLLGSRALQSLALIAEVVHGVPTRFSDPARFSFALGGKDRQPFPVPLKTYDESLSVLRKALDSAKLGDTAKIDGFRRLDQFCRAIEKRCNASARFDEIIRHENSLSKELAGRSVFDKLNGPRSSQRQLSLF
jgi:hypothetical protein